MIAKRSACSICGRETTAHKGWFLVSENRWLDRLRIFSWHPSLASQKGIKSVCSREHLRKLIAYWLDRASLSLLPEGVELPIPITSDRCRMDAELSPPLAGRLVGELSVHREAFSRVWSGSTETLESILDALVPTSDEVPTAQEGFALFRHHEPAQELLLH